MTIRFKLILASLMLLMLNAGLGYFARQQQHQMGARAMGIYDGAYMGLSYVTKVQTDLMRFAAAHGDGTESAADPASQSALKQLMANLDVATERAMNDKAREDGQALMKKFQSITQQTKPAAFQAGLVQIDKDLTKLVRRYGNDGLAARDDVEESVNRGDQLVLTVASSVALISLGVFVVLWFAVIPPLRRAVMVAGAIAGGTLDTVIRSKGRSETARLLQALSRMQTALAEALTAREAQTAADAERHKLFEERLAGALRGMADTVEADATAAVDHISQRTNAMAETANTMRESASRADNSARDAAAAAEQTLATSQTVASAAEQLSASIREISSQVNQSAAVVGKAVTAGEATRARIGALNETVTRISSVADIISGIAAQTNLLALNATIEAARAGDAGKGFAVVANEVKQLASQTSRSTTEISSYIQQVRAATIASIEAVTVIGDMIEEINGISGSIAAAVEEQGAATAEIARSVNETAQAAGMMNDRIVLLSSEAKATGLGASEVGDGAAQLAASMADLKRSLVRVVRSSTGEVDRRVYQRYDVVLGCQFTLNASGTHTGQTSDISEGGARIEGTYGAQPDETGILTLDGVALRIPVRVRAVSGTTARLIFTFDRDMAAAWRGIMAGIVARMAA